MTPQPDLGNNIRRSYPDWFWNTPFSEDALFAVGLCETSVLHPENSENKAIEDGIASLAKLLSVHVKAEVRYIGDMHGSTSDSDIQEYVSPETEAYVREHHRVVAKSVSPELTFVLLQLGEKDDSTPIISPASAKIPEEPTWVTSLPKESGYIYASGESDLYLREADSWRNAEKGARVALALSIRTKVRGLVIRSEDQTTFAVSTASADAQLSNVQIIGRWKNSELNTCHVLMRIAEPR